MKHESHDTTTRTWLTPLPLIRALGEFDLDPCGLSHWPTATEIYQLPTDGFREEWHGRVWLNPPYGQEQWKWLARLAEHGTGTALIFARTETLGFQREVWAKASAVLFLHGRVTFHYPNGKPAPTNGGAPSVLIAYGDEDAAALARSGIDGTFVTYWRRPVATTAELDLFGGAA